MRAKHFDHFPAVILSGNAEVQHKRTLYTSQKGK